MAFDHQTEQPMPSMRDDPHYEQAKAIVLTHRNASPSLVQRRLQIRYNLAVMLIEAMEGDVLGPPNSNGVRPLLQCAI